MASDEGGFLTRFRAWMNTGPGRLATIVVALAIIGGAVALGIAYMRAPSKAVDQIRKKGRKALWYCPACKQSGEVRISYDAEWPIDCPKCGKHTAVRAFKCTGRNCGKIIPEGGPGTIFRCPYCGKVYDRRMLPPGDLLNPKRR